MLFLHGGETSTSMKSKTFLRKIFDPYVWGNIIAMVVVVVLLCAGVKYGLEVYTRHGEGIAVPDLQSMNYVKARDLLRQIGLKIEVSDSGYNRKLPANCILSQTPGAGVRVKEGHKVYITLNSAVSPSFAIPDVIDNGTAREARAKLTAIGFRVLDDKPVNGEKDWVYGILCRGRMVNTGDIVSIDTPLTLLVGRGTYDEDDVDVEYFDGGADAGTHPEDGFEEVTDPMLEQ